MTLKGLSHDDKLDQASGELGSLSVIDLLRTEGYNPGSSEIQSMSRECVSLGLDGKITFGYTLDFLNLEMCRRCRDK